MTSGMLTENHREYLQGKRELSESNKQSYDNRIRNRIRAGIQDFALIFKQLPPKDRKQIYETRHQSRNPDGKSTIQDSIMHGTEYMIAFTYLGLHDRGYDVEDIERILEEAIRKAEIRRGKDNTDLTDLLDVSIEIQSKREDHTDIDELEKRFERNDPLTSGELLFLFKQDRITAEDLNNTTTDEVNWSGENKQDHNS